MAQRPRPPGGSGGAAAPAAAAAAAARQPNELESRLRRDTPFMCNIRFKNDLPEIPADPKLLLTRRNPEDLAAFSTTALERAALRELLLPADLGIPVTLLDADRYNAPPEGEQGALHPRDAALLQGEIRLPGQGPSPAKPKRFAAKSVEVSWLMRTTYISAAEADPGAASGPGGAAGAAARRSAAATAAARAAAAEAAWQSREGQMAEIEASFAAAQQPITAHPTKRGVVATEVLPILPDLDRWPHKYIQVLFDEEPTNDGALASVHDPKLRRALADRTMLKSYNLAAGEGEKQVPALALLVPKAGLEAARAGGPGALADEQEVEDLEGDYLWDQEYAWGHVRRAGEEQGQEEAQDSYLVRREGDKVAYSLFATKLRCRKRKRKADDDPIPSKVAITHRALTDAEIDENVSRLHPDATDAPPSP
ncbi:MAG: RNA polymerase II-associated [Monoraphidium minutum]|nr:MAG: RNA polymerase II-associated [Monoraphidium minutum]